MVWVKRKAPRVPRELLERIGRHSAATLHEAMERRGAMDYTIKPLQEKIFDHGELVYQQPTLSEIQKYCREQIDTLWDEVKRFENPHNYYVDLSQKLWDIKQDLLRKNYR